MSARAFAPRTRYCAARTLAPYATHFSTKSSVPAAWRRLARTSAQRVPHHRLGDRHPPDQPLEREQLGAGHRALTRVASWIAVVVRSTSSSSSSGGWSITMWNMNRSSWASGSG